ncbi:MAG: hypothetical protein SX243_09330 [Acidobacteriota bacterium]|nr:hypothetical protein [Acidobacteriota bacterium]
MRAWKAGLEGIGATVLFAAWTLVTLRPPWSLLDRRIAHDVGDPVLNLYLLRWVSEHLGAGFEALWNAPFFYPTPNTLSLSDHLLGPALLALPLRALGTDATTAFNLLFLLSFVLSGLAAAWVGRAAGLGRTGALITGLVFAFGPGRWLQVSHFQMLQTQWIPILLWAFYRQLHRPTAGRCAVFLGIYGLHLTGSLYLALMIHPALAVMALDRWPRLRRSSPQRRRLLGITALLALGLLGTVMLPYLIFDSGFETHRGAHEWRYYSTTFASYWTAPEFGRWSGAWSERWQRPENALFPGVLVTLLIAGWILYRRRRMRAKARALDANPAQFPPPLPLPRRFIVGGLTVAGLALLVGDLIVLGTAGKLPAVLPPNKIPLLAGLGLLGLLIAGFAYRSGTDIWPWPRLPWLRPWDRGLLLAAGISLLLGHAVAFEALAWLVPGFDHLRVPARFFLVASFPIAFFAGRGADALIRRLRPIRGGLLAVLLIAGVALETLPLGIPWMPLPEAGDAAPAYRWLAGRQDVSALVELPCRNRDEDLAWMYLQPHHGHPLVNGFSGFYPPYYAELREHLCSPVPDDRAVPLLRRLGVSHLLVHHPRVFHRRWMRRTLWALSDDPELELVFEQNGVQVLRLLPSAEVPPRPVDPPP